MRKIKVLFITHAPWRNDTSIGNSYSNIFAGMDDRLEFAQIYIRDGMPENNLVNKYFHISEQDLIKSVFTRKAVGTELKNVGQHNNKPEQFSKSYNTMRSLRWNILLLARDIIGVLGQWKSSELDAFLDEYKPDIIFGALSFLPIVNKLMVYSKKRTSASLIVYPWDDWYHVNKNTYSPFYYIRIFLERYYIRRCVDQAAMMYTITEQMRDEYTKMFGKPCKVLRKGYSFDHRPIYKNNDLSTINMIYAGNIGDNRWKTLAALASVIENSNKMYSTQIHLKIHTLTPINADMEQQLNILNVSEIGRPLAATEVNDVLAKADVLVHVEPTDSVMLENCRLSFSTKIVDYLHSAKCILAVGGENASMRYLKENDAAIVGNTYDEIEKAIKRIATNPDIVNEYSNKAWQCGCRNHSINKTQDMIYGDFLQEVAKRKSNES